MITEEVLNRSFIAIYMVLIYDNVSGNKVQLI